MIRQYGGELIWQGINQCGEDLEIDVPEKDRRFMLRAYLSLFLGGLDDFFSGGLREDPSYLAGRCEALLHHSIRRTLRNLAELGPYRPG